VQDVWDAITSPDRLARWFLPVTGDLRPGGRYQLQGKAGGEIRACEPPRLLAVTWVFGEGEPSGVRVRLESGPDGHTVLELEHSALVDPQKWDEFGPGAVGVGWDLTLLGLGMYLRGDIMSDDERAAWPMSGAGRAFVTGSASAWGAAHEASGATADDAGRAARNTTTFYAPA